MILNVWENIMSLSRVHDNTQLLFCTRNVLIKRISRQREHVCVYKWLTMRL